jgi:hypothetical protein
MHCRGCSSRRRAAELPAPRPMHAYTIAHAERSCTV